MNLIYAGMKAQLSDGTTMPVRGVVLDPATHQRTHLVLGAHGLFGPDVIVPATAIWLIDQDVHLSISCADVVTMPTFHRFHSSANAEHHVEPVGAYFARRRAPYDKRRRPLNHGGWRAVPAAGEAAPPPAWSPGQG